MFPPEAAPPGDAEALLFSMPRRMIAAKGVSAMFITFEGIDGSGKSSQLRALAGRLRSEGHRVTVTREPGGTPGAEDIRRLLVEGSADRWTPESELLLFTAARFDHLTRLILPATADGGIVLCDRFFDSTQAYQGENPELLRKAIDLHEQFICIRPDLTILLDLPAERSLERSMTRLQGAGSAEDRFERQGLERQERIRQRFLAIARADPDRVRVVDADREMDSVAEDVREVVRGAFMSFRAVTEHPGCGL